MPAHRLEIVKPGRGSWLAQCSCGQSYRQPSQADPQGSRYWTPSEVSKAKIDRLHDRHLAELQNREAAVCNQIEDAIKAAAYAEAVMARFFSGPDEAPHP